VAAPSDALADIEDLIEAKSFREKQNTETLHGEKRKRKHCMVKLEEEPSSSMVKLEEEPSNSSNNREQQPSSSSKGEEPSSSTLQDVKIMVESLGDAPKKKQPQEKIVQKEVAAISWQKLSYPMPKLLQETPKHVQPFHRIGYNAVMNAVARLSLPKGPLAPPDGLASLYKFETDSPQGAE
jgi:hypothetical protein